MFTCVVQALLLGILESVTQEASLLASSKHSLFEFCQVLLYSTGEHLSKILLSYMANFA